MRKQTDRTDRWGRTRAETKRDNEMKADRLTDYGFSTVAMATQNPEFTGERIVPGKTVEALFREHEERYVFAAQYVSGKDVLDVACGTGVGTSFLREAGARMVWGLDIDPDTVAFAKSRYKACEFFQGEATNLCLSDNSVDVVASFETLEHLKDQRKFMLECRRVLRPGGLLICSTPNTTIYRWQGVNPYHVHELTAREFKELVETYFGDLQIFSQAEHVYPFYLLRRSILRVLGSLNLKNAVKLILGRSSSVEPFRVEFVNDFNSLNTIIVPYRWSILVQPMYLIVIARKL